MRLTKVAFVFGLAWTLLFLPCGAAGAQKNYVNSELPWHEAVLDGQGKLLAWNHAERNQGYDKVIHLAWDFMEHKDLLVSSSSPVTLFRRQTYRQ